MSLVDDINAWVESGQPLLIDGGLGSELEARGYDVSSPLWSAQLILQQPSAVLQVHRDFLDAGARCIATASYQASVPGLARAGLNPDEIKAVFARSVELACQARDDFLGANPDCEFKPLVAASVGPYGAYLADGSEYRGNYGLSDGDLRTFHQQRLRWLEQAGADLIVCETIPDLQEAKVLAQLLTAVSIPSWVSFCCRDAKTLHDGSSVHEAAGLYNDSPSVFAVGVNCCPCDLVPGLIDELRAASEDKLIVVYPNSGAQYDAADKRWHGDESLSQWSQQALSWFAAGAGIIGGCCRIGPDKIRELTLRESWHC